MYKDQVFRFHGIPQKIIHDRRPQFDSQFMKDLYRLLGTEGNFSTAYHPQTDGASERTNKTLNQMLRYVVDRKQQGWVKALPYVRFAIMSTVNASTGHTPNFLRFGQDPRVIPPIAETYRPQDLDNTRAL